MDPLIRNLKSTTFFGNRLTRRQIANIQETVRLCPGLSRAELGRTICEHLGWRTPKGRDRLSSAQRLLTELERLGILALPPKRGPGRGPQKPIRPGPRTAPRPAIRVPLADLTPLRLELVREAERVAEFNEWVQRYHPLGYRQPFGVHLRYFLRDRDQRLLGCLLFDFAARRLPCRDRWIGWQGLKHRPHLRLVVRQTRFLLLPWVEVKNLASHALARAARQLPDDWERRHGYRPVLVETYVDPRRHAGTCYRAANWQRLGRTQARVAMGGVPAKTPKDVWACPLQADWRTILHEGPPPRTRRRRTRPPADAGFVQLWQGVLATVTRVAREHDRQWLRRQRVLNTLLVMLFVFRLAFASDRRGYATVLAELWDPCRQLGVDLPQEQPVSAAAICKARAKVAPEVFRQVHRAVLAEAPAPARWQGHRVFAVDGSKVNGPRPLVAAGYDTPGPGAHYPQGLLSCLHELRTEVPVDCDLHAHLDERRAARRHLSAPAPGDVVVYDRGYYSFALLHAHFARSLHAVFRLKSNANNVFAAFIQGSRREAVVEVRPTDNARQAYPDATLRPYRVRLVKYTRGATTFTLATTLLDRRRYPAQRLADLYHARWKIEELYKTAKQCLRLEQFRGRSEPLVKQELYAHFTLIALTRLFTHRSEEHFRAGPDGHGRPAMLANLTHSLHTVSRNLEGLFLQQARVVGQAVQHILDGIGLCRQRRRPGRSYPRQSKKPVGKWRKRNVSTKKK